jgi:acetylornithine deacetylase/succinyl-diaminopimelate desuccinylase-like protein
MDGAVLPSNSPFVEAFRHTAEQVLGRSVRAEIASGPSDLYVVNKYFRSPAIMFGTGGGNAHAADEYLTVEDLVPMTKALALFALEWCGPASD